MSATQPSEASPYAAPSAMCSESATSSRKNVVRARPTDRYWTGWIGSAFKISNNANAPKVSERLLLRVRRERRDVPLRFESLCRLLEQRGLRKELAAEASMRPIGLQRRYRKDRKDRCDQDGLDQQRFLHDALRELPRRHNA